MSHWKSIKQRVLIFLLFTCTITAVVGLMNVTSDIVLLLTVPGDEFCDAPLASLWQIGITVVIVSFALGMGLMW